MWRRTPACQRMWCVLMLSACAAWVPPHRGWMTYWLKRLIYSDEASGEAPGLVWVMKSTPSLLARATTNNAHMAQQPPLKTLCHIIGSNTFSGNSSLFSKFLFPISGLELRPIELWLPCKMNTTRSLRPQRTWFFRGRWCNWEDADWLLFKCVKTLWVRACEMDVQDFINEELFFSFCKAADLPFQFIFQTDVTLKQTGMRLWWQIK